MQEQTVTDTVQELAGQIRRRHSKKLAPIQRRYDADDLVQDTALRAHAFAETCSAETAEQLRCWVLTISKHAAAGALTRELAAKRSTRHEREYPSGDVLACVKHDFMDGIISADEVATRFPRVQQQLTLIPMRQAQAVRLRYLEQQSYSEIAGRMGVTVQAVRSLVSKGLAAIRAAV